MPPAHDGAPEALHLGRAGLVLEIEAELRDELARDGRVVDRAANSLTPGLLRHAPSTVTLDSRSLDFPSHPHQPITQVESVDQG